jgi:hypothetical protein
VSLKLFLDFFETFCGHAPRNKLRMIQISLFLDLRIKSYGCLKFLGEVWAGRAWAGTNEEKFIKVLKSEGRRRKKAGGNNKKMQPAHGRLATSGHSPAIALSNCKVSFF